MIAASAISRLPAFPSVRFDCFNVIYERLKAFASSEFSKNTWTERNCVVSRKMGHERILLRGRSEKVPEGSSNSLEVSFALEHEASTYVVMQSKKDHQDWQWWLISKCSANFPQLISKVSDVPDCRPGVTISCGKAGLLCHRVHTVATTMRSHLCSLWDLHTTCTLVVIGLVSLSKTLQKSKGPVSLYNAEKNT